MLPKFLNLLVAISRFLNMISDSFKCFTNNIYSNSDFVIFTYLDYVGFYYELNSLNIPRATFRSSLQVWDGIGDELRFSRKKSNWSTETLIWSSEEQTLISLNFFESDCIRFSWFKLLCFKALDITKQICERLSWSTNFYAYKNLLSSRSKADRSTFTIEEKALYVQGFRNLIYRFV